MFEKFDHIDANITDYIINSTHTIRNNLVLVMGYSSGSEIGYSIALIEIDLLNLNDLIQEEIDLCHRF